MPRVHPPTYIHLHYNYIKCHFKKEPLGWKRNLNVIGSKLNPLSLPTRCFKAACRSQNFLPRRTKAPGENNHPDYQPTGGLAQTLLFFLSGSKQTNCVFLAGVLIKCTLIYCPHGHFLLSKSVVCWYNQHIKVIAVFPKSLDKLADLK